MLWPRPRIHPRLTNEERDCDEAAIERPPGTEEPLVPSVVFSFLFLFFCFSSSSASRTQRHGSAVSERREDMRAPASGRAAIGHPSRRRLRSEPDAFFSARRALLHVLCN